jgi:hypothetical protein
MPMRTSESVHVSLVHVNLAPLTCRTCLSLLLYRPRTDTPEFAGHNITPCNSSSRDERRCNTTVFSPRHCILRNQQQILKHPTIAVYRSFGHHVVVGYACYAEVSLSHGPHQPPAEQRHETSNYIPFKNSFIYIMNVHHLSLIAHN